MIINYYRIESADRLICIQSILTGCGRPLLKVSVNVSEIEREEEEKREGGRGGGQEEEEDAEENKNIIVYR